VFRILSLDGGGIKGAFTASVVAALEDATSKSFSDHFDLITGTSTGGIIAIGLGLGLSAKDRYCCLLPQQWSDHLPRHKSRDGPPSIAALAFRTEIFA
jgi:patatin-like phospholipase/acyl hydrolase